MTHEDVGLPRLYQTSISPLSVRTSMMVWPRKSSDSRLKCCFTLDLISSSSSHTRTLMRSVALWHSLQFGRWACQVKTITTTITTTWATTTTASANRVTPRRLGLFSRVERQIWAWTQFKYSSPMQTHAFQDSNSQWNGPFPVHLHLIQLHV